MALIGTIETAADLDPSRSEREQIKRDTSGKSKYASFLNISIALYAFDLQIVHLPRLLPKWSHAACRGRVQLLLPLFSF